MAALVPYAFEGRELRTLDRAGDAAAILGYEHTPHLTRGIDAAFAETAQP